MNERKEPRPGEFYRHFKNKLYQVIAVARDAETEVPFVVYQALYGDYGIWTRPLENFMSPVDREKYPQAAQEWRFERVMPNAAERETVAWMGKARETISQPEDSGTEQTPSRVLMDFLEADTPELRRELLLAHIDQLTQRDLDGIYTVCGLSAYSGDIRTQAEGIIRCLSVQEHYEGAARSERRRDV